VPAGVVITPVSTTQERPTDGRPASEPRRRRGGTASCSPALFVAVYFKRPKSHFYTGKRSDVLRPDAPNFHTSKPDRDNLDKAILDALTNAGIWKDDAQVCAGIITKSYVQFIAGANVTITTL